MPARMSKELYIGYANKSVNSENVIKYTWNYKEEKTRGTQKLGHRHDE